MVRLARPLVHRQVASEVVAHVVEAASEEAVALAEEHSAEDDRRCASEQ